MGWRSGESVSAMTCYQLDHLDYLETEAIHVMREVAEIGRAHV